MAASFSCSVVLSAGDVMSTEKHKLGCGVTSMENIVRHISKSLCEESLCPSIASDSALFMLSRACTLRGRAPGHVQARQCALMEITHPPTPPDVLLTLVQSIAYHAPERRVDGRACIARTMATWSSPVARRLCPHDVDIVSVRPVSNNRQAHAQHTESIISTETTMDRRQHVAWPRPRVRARNKQHTECEGNVVRYIRITHSAALVRR